MISIYDSTILKWCICLFIHVCRCLLCAPSLPICLIIPVKFLTFHVSCLSDYHAILLPSPMFWVFGLHVGGPLGWMWASLSNANVCSLIWFVQTTYWHYLELISYEKIWPRRSQKVLTHRVDPFFIQSHFI
jgi:hypothetical protein